MRNNPKVIKGFTLIELLVVIAILALLAALLVPVLRGAKAKALRTACQGNLRQLNLGVRMYSDDSHEASPSPGPAGLPPSKMDSLYLGYKSLMKNYVGLKGASSPQDKLFACPADVSNPSWHWDNRALPYHFVQKSLHENSISDYSSYAFNGGDNAARKLGNSDLAFPGLTAVKLSSVKHPARTILLAEISAFVPYSWHDPSSHGVASMGGTIYNDSKNVVSFVDGHVGYLKMYWSYAIGFACCSNPPASYDYQWSPD